MAIKEREKKISLIKDKEVKSTSKEDKEKWEKQQIEDAKDEENRQKRAEDLKRQRSEEAKQLIGQRSSEARALFERNSSQGQMNFKKLSQAKVELEQVEEKPKEDAINANEVSTEDNIVPPPESFGNDDNRLNEVQPLNEVPPMNEVPQLHEVQPDVTGAASHQPDLIQDVAAKQGPGMFLELIEYQ